MAFKMKGFSPFTKKTGNPSLEQGLGTDEDMREYLENKEKEKNKQPNPFGEDTAEAGAAGGLMGGTVKTPPSKDKETEVGPDEKAEDKEAPSVEEKPKDEEEEEKDDDLPFKMSVSFSGPFNKGIAKDKSMEEDLKESSKSKEKKILTRDEIDDLYNQLNPNNPDRD